MFVVFYTYGIWRKDARPDWFILPWPYDTLMEALEEAMERPDPKAMFAIMGPGMPWGAF